MTSPTTTRTADINNCNIPMKKSVEQQPNGDSKKTKKILETCPSFARANFTSPDTVQKYRFLSDPHVQSFNYFLTTGLKKAVQDIDPYEFDLVDSKLSALDPTTATKQTTVETVKFWFENVTIGQPFKNVQGAGKRGSGTQTLYPRECRELGIMYAGVMSGEFCYQTLHKNLETNSATSSSRIVRTQKRLGEIPIMVLSKACNLANKSCKQLVGLKEEDNEMGGYFIVNGIERIVRLLQVQRRNHPMGLVRSSFQKRGPSYSEYGCAMRCANCCGDQTTITNTLHYLTTGGVTVRFSLRKQEFLVPIILLLRACCSSSSDTSTATTTDTTPTLDNNHIKVAAVTDEELYNKIVQGDVKNTFLRARAELLLQDARRFGFYTPEEALAYLGSRFRNLVLGKPSSVSDTAIGHYIIRKYIMIHLPHYQDKQECLLLMLRKLYAIVGGSCLPDNADSLQNHELLLPGHFITAFVKEKLEETLRAIHQGISKDMRQDYTRVVKDLQTTLYWGKCLDRYGQVTGSGVGNKVNYLLATGNVKSTSGLDLMQASGFTIVAEKINFIRYLSHFRSVHRGQFFTTMKSTTVRKLLPDQWGFLCPVNTPDGSPCGLLSHLTRNCSVLSYPEETIGPNLKDLEELLFSLGISPIARNEGGQTPLSTHLSVCIDGRMIGAASAKICKTVSYHLRELKVSGMHVPPTLEVAHFPPVLGGNGPHPGLYLFTGSARMIRPVLHRATGKVEYIGPMEQPFLDIACLPTDVREGITTHQELDPTNMLSLLASLTPFSDYNQSPRNMYQCQMAKQTMGTPCHALNYRVDNKLYRRHDVQAPLVQTARHGEFSMDEYPNGFNAVVAVLSYTGYDMEDAMIINKASYDRGFGHASVYKTIIVDLEEESKHASSEEQQPRMKFNNIKPKNYRPKGFHAKNINDEESNLIHQSLGEDGLPIIGEWVDEGDPLYCIIDELTGTEKTVRHKEKERAIIQCVRRLGQGGADAVGKGPVKKTVISTNMDKVCITLRFPRNPVIGDKFSSRHGQKGVLSILWPHEDMPFSESGIYPDVIINPHAFPSRMTIGMLIESMAGKSGSLHGQFQDATPFSFHETGDKLAIDYFGEQLQAAGYNYYGSEPLYSGVSGCLLQADLYIGVVYYQRLRHMVSDKFQVRSKGPVNPLTRQPIKGRKKGGGVRLGEMERDSLLSHGAAFTLQDRLLNCSDKSIAYACSRCGDILYPSTERCVVLSAGQSKAEARNTAKLRVYCRNPKCLDVVRRDGGNDEAVQPIILPYVFRYLCNELAAMNIKLTCKIE